MDAVSSVSWQEDCRVTQAGLEAAVLRVRPSLQRGVESVVDLCSVPWSNVGGLDDVKLRIQQVTDIFFPLLLLLLLLLRSILLAVSNCQSGGVGEAGRPS